MQNFELLKAAGSVNKPVLLKRGISATLMNSFMQLNILCHKEMVKLFFVNVEFVHMKKQQEIHLIFQLFQFLNKKHIYQYWLMLHIQQEEVIFYLPCAKAALAIGADGVMAEVHPDPAVALSDSAQQMDLNQFDEFYSELQTYNIWLKFNRKVSSLTFH